MAVNLYMHKIEQRMQICLRNLRNRMQHRSCFAIPLGELKFKFANSGKIKKSFNHHCSLTSTRPIQPNHFQADLIWCDSTWSFKIYATYTNGIQGLTPAELGNFFVFT
jgi:hypothetical protein